MLRAPRTSTRDIAAVYPFLFPDQRSGYVALPFVVVHRRHPPKDEVVAAPSKAAATTLVIEPLPRTSPPSQWWCPPRLAPTRRSRKTTRRPADRTGTSDRPLAPLLPGAACRRLSATIGLGCLRQATRRPPAPPVGDSAPPADSTPPTGHSAPPGAARRRLSATRWFSGHHSASSVDHPASHRVPPSALDPRRVGARPDFKPPAARARTPPPLSLKEDVFATPVLSATWLHLAPSTICT